MAKGNHKRVRGKPQIHSLLEHYQPIDGVVDEMVDASGNPRPAWKQFIENGGCAKQDFSQAKHFENTARRPSAGMRQKGLATDIQA